MLDIKKGNKKMKLKITIEWTAYTVDPSDLQEVVKALQLLNRYDASKGTEIPVAFQVESIPETGNDA